MQEYKIGEYVRAYQGCVPRIARVEGFTDRGVALRFHNGSLNDGKGAFEDRVRSTPLRCIVGRAKPEQVARFYELDDEDNDDVFDYLNHAKPTKGGR